jgi:hypothetical protein
MESGYTRHGWHVELIGGPPDSLEVTMFSDARWGDDPRDRNTETHDRSDSNRDDDARTVGRGPGENARGAKGDEHVRDRQHDRLRDAHWLERDRDSRHVDPRDVFMKDLNLPRGLEREIVRYRGHEYTLRGSETRTLSTVGAFRVVPTRDLGDHSGREVNPRSGDLRHLREQKLIDTVRMDGRRDLAVVLTTRGRDLLESHRHHDREPERERGREPRQEFYSGVKRPRELEHDAHIYRAYLREAERLAEREARIERVVLDYELKREYQQWLHERDRERDDYDGHPDRDAREIDQWALKHELPYFDEQVHFPDLRVEYEERDGRRDHVDVEITTLHYRGAHGAAAARSGFNCYRISSARIVSRTGRGGGRGRHPRLAEELLN